MGIYSEYLDSSFDWATLQKERKKQLLRISQLRDGKDIFTFASALTKQADISIDYSDRVPIIDQISNLEGDKIDIILETPGGYAEVVEDIIKYIRNRFSEVTMIVPGYAKSAGTIMVMAGDEILMEPASTLGPIDAQMLQGGKRFSAHAFLEGLEKIKQEVQERGYLNRAYVPILQNISPGEIQNCENAQAFSKKLVTDWLSEYKFKFWETHLSTGEPVTVNDKKTRAEEIAKKLCDHGHWLTHGASITINDLREMRLKVTDFSGDTELFDAISRYYILLKMSFDTTNIFKIYETPNSQIYRFVIPQVSIAPQQMPNMAVIEFECPNCKTKTKIQANLKEGVPIQKGSVPFPKDNVFMCPACNNRNDLSTLRNQIESQSKKKIV
ncbi:MAG: Serine dehydrogenase proteinase [Candidatus Argoarchaeum ethanivorans]|uniref:Serine dehydrogenase proteinase n=1 Tax=Candidatus Argoarchaeum ethanivorans TaxID=2608793 RepID=A0A811TC31_9EURY|nr:MAG: Serine dehydrogenase proteinase [Candidatus Argoarchaeum ethanivorans]